MQMATQLRERLAQAQEQAGSLTVTGEAGGGLVRVVMNGRHEIVELKIDPKTLVPSEVALVEDLIRAAVNQATAKVVTGLKERMGGMAKDFGVDLSALEGLGFPK
jgi:DNA-binding YbaB/EbfC family protein